MKNRLVDMRNGFTLIELLVVLCIIGILATISMFSMGNKSNLATTKMVTHEIYDHLQHARLKALAENRNVKVVFNAAAGSMTIDNTTYVVLDNVKTAFGAGSVTVLPDNGTGTVSSIVYVNNTVIFTPTGLVTNGDGSVAPGYIFIQDNVANDPQKATDVFSVYTYGAGNILRVRWNSTAWVTE